MEVFIKINLFLTQKLENYNANGCWPFETIYDLSLIVFLVKKFYVNKISLFKHILTSNN